MAYRHRPVLIVTKEGSTVNRLHVLDPAAGTDEEGTTGHLITGTSFDDDTGRMP